MPNKKDNIMITLFIASFFTLFTISMTDTTIDYQECKLKDFKGTVRSGFTSCNDMKKLYSYDKDSKSVKRK